MQYLRSLLEHWAGRYYVALAKELEGERDALRAEVADLRVKLSKAIESERSLVQQLATVQKRCEEQASELRGLDEKLKLAGVQIKMAEAENELLANIHAEDVARRKFQRSIYDTKRAMAVATLPEQEGDG